MGITTKKSHIVLALVIAGIFAAASACLAVLGVFIYRTAATDHSQHNLTSASEYLRTQVQSCDDASALRIAALNGQTPALVITRRENGEDQELWIFVENGYLRAANAPSGESVSAKDGKKITPLSSMDPRIGDGDLVEISLRSDSASAVSRVWLPGIGGGDE